MGADPARQFVIGLAEHARNSDGPAVLLDGEVRFLERNQRDGELRRLKGLHLELSRRAAGGDAASSVERDQVFQHLTALTRIGARD
jgi:hypothetical protein